MKKTIALTHPKLQPARLVDSIKYDIKKYLNRERRKPLPAGVDYWTFDCRFGASAEVATSIFTAEINKQIDAAVAQELPEFYIEILAKAGKHQPRADLAADDESAAD